jgi:diguanylate cyclase (GGDEF)-like protein/PAS domain S-box-containing protein
VTADQPEPRPALDGFWAGLVACHGDLSALLRTVAEQVVAVLGDGCVLTTLTPDGTELEPAAIAHCEPRVAAAMRSVLGGERARVGEGIAGTVAAERHPILLNDPPRHPISATTPEQFLPFLRDHPMQALMIVPLVAAGELVGTLGAVRTSSSAPFVTAELRLLQSLGERAALAIADATASPRSVGPEDHEAVYRHSAEGILVTTPDGHILAANPSACAALGRTEHDLVRHGCDAVFDQGDQNLGPALAERLAAGHVRAELVLCRGDGTRFSADVASTIYTTIDGKARTSLIFRDVTALIARREAAAERLAELERVAEHDPLTDLDNRRRFAAAAEEALTTADRLGLVAHLIFIDIDDLKEINDLHGHAAGDEAIVALASAIRRQAADTEAACRFGGDEFTMLTLGSTDDEVTDLIDRIERDAATAVGPFLGLSFSTGVAARPVGAAMTVEDLLERADRAMYDRKRSCRGGGSAKGPTVTGMPRSRG